MPNQAPAYGDLKVGTNIRPAPQQDPGIINANTYGAGVAQATAGALSQVAKVQEDERQKAVKVDVFKATNELDIHRTQLGVGFRSQEGSNAFDGAPKVSEEYRKKVAEISDRLTTPEAKEAFGRYADDRWVETDRDVQEHVARERKKEEAEVYGTRRSLTIESAVANRNKRQIDKNGNPSADPDSWIHQELGRLEGMHLVRIGQQGKENTPALERLTKEDQAEVWASVINADIKSGDYESAKRRFDANSDRLVSSDKEKLGASIKIGEEIAEADAITAKATQPVDGVRPTMQDAMANSATSKNPEVNRRAAENVKRFYHDAALAKDTDDRATYDGMAKTLDANGGDIRSLEADPRFADLSVSWQDMLRGRARKASPEPDAEKKTMNNVINTDSIRRMIDSGETVPIKVPLLGGINIKVPVDAVRVYQLAIEGRLTPAQTEDVQQHLAKKGQKAHLTTPRLDNIYQAVTGDKTAMAGAELYKQVEERIPPGVELTDKMLMETVAMLMVPGEIVEGGMVDKDTTYTKAIAEGKGDQFMPDVPSEMERPIAAKMKEDGYKKVNAEMIRGFYKYKVRGMATPMKNGVPMTIPEAVQEGQWDEEGRAIYEMSKPKPKPITETSRPITPWRDAHGYQQERDYR